ncbi:hypothetical protein D9M68_18640 [compost metagenome]
MNNDLLPLLKGITRLTKALSQRLTVESGRVVGNNGKEVTKQVREWYGVTMSVNGVYSFDYSAAKFTEILHADPRSVLDAALFEDQTFASINTLSLTQCTGKVVIGDKKEGFTKAGNVKVIIRVTGT